jgi:hypothetical protein
VVQNTGTEFTLNTVNVKSTDFKWSTSFNLSFAANKLVSFPGLATSSYSKQYEVGQPLSIQYRLTGVTVNPADGKYEYASPSGETENPNVNADGVFTSSLTPKFYGGLGNSFSYKCFQLDFFFQFAKQLNYNYFQSNNYSLSIAGLFSGTLAGNLPVAVIGNTWQGPGDVSKYGRLSTIGGADPNFDLSRSTFNISDASYIRLKNLAFSYTLPKSWQQVMHLQNASIYLQGQNLFTITNYFGLDPESGSTGLPPLRMITVGIHASL